MLPYYVNRLARPFTSKLKTVGTIPIPTSAQYYQ
jgi:hypothetical protein